MGNVILFTGEEKYLLLKELNRRRDGFLQKFGRDSLFVFDSYNFDISKISELMAGGGLFSSKKMVIIKGVPVDTNLDNKIDAANVEKFTDVFLKTKVSADVLIIFVSYKPDKRLKLYKSLLTMADLKEFHPMTSIQYKLFVKENSKDIVWTDEILEYFLAKMGKDLFRIESEVDKLACWCNKMSIKNVTIDIIDDIVFSELDVNSFLFFDYLFEDKSKLLGLVDDMSNEGIDFNQALGMLYWGVRSLLFTADVYKSGVKDAKTIAQITKYHPFVITKQIKHIDKIMAKRASINTFYKSLVKLEFDIKSGKLPDFCFWLNLKKFINDLF